MRSKTKLLFSVGAPLLWVTLTAFCGRISAETPCRGPVALEQKIHAHPNAEGYSALGGWFGEQKQYACAVDAFRAALKLEPNSATIHYLLGLSLYTSTQTVASIDEFNRALQLEPNSTRTRLALGTALHDSGRPAEASQQWEEALRIDPTSVVALDWLSKLHIEQSQYVAAVDLLRSAPYDEELILDKAVAYSKAGMFDQAIAALHGAIEREPSSLRLNTALATIFVQRRRYQDAAATLQKIRTMYPGNAELLLLSLRVLVMMGDAAAAEPLAKELLAEKPGDFDALYLNGILDREKGDLAAARLHLEPAATLRPDHYDVQYNLGATLAKLHQPEAARTHLEKAIELDSTQPEARFELAGVLRALGQVQQAQAQLTLYRHQLQANQNRDLASSLSEQAAQKLAAGDTQLALQLYWQAIDATPNDAVLRYNLALALDRSGDFVAEREALSHAVRIRTDFAEAENQLGVLAARFGDAADAKQHFRKALTAAPQYAEAENNLGTILGQEGRDRDAEEHFRAAVKSNPRYTQAWINLAATLASDSRFGEAQEAIQNALHLESQNPEAKRLEQMLSTEGQSVR